MRTVAFHALSWTEFTEWAKTDAKVFERLTRLISETARDPFGGIGKPEPLKHNLQGYWSRRITDEHRLVYRVTADSIIIASRKYHYG